MENKGYYDSSKWPFSQPEPKLEVHTVICNNCNATWQEEIKRLSSTIAGYARRYDFCSLCEQQYIKNHGRMEHFLSKEAKRLVQMNITHHQASVGPYSSSGKVKGLVQDLKPKFESVFGSLDTETLQKYAEDL